LKIASGVAANQAHALTIAPDLHLAVSPLDAAERPDTMSMAGRP
jgi:hypothetical protein